MYAKCLSTKTLYPPFVSGGLWHKLGVVLSAGIRHYPPEAVGGANYSYNKNLGNFRHSSTKRIATVIIYGGLRKK